MGMKKQVPEPFSFQPFAGLKKILSSRTNIPVSRPAKQELHPPVCDEKLFDDAMKDVREIREFRSIPVHRNRSAVVLRKHPLACPEQEALRSLEELIRGTSPVVLQDTQEYVEWVHPGHPKNIIRKLREGRFSFQDSIDLHGLVLDEAEAEVEDFLKESLKRCLRCVRIIHGRGLRSPRGPVVKAMVVDMLSRRFRKDIIAFVTARQCDGGLGAVYVLLR